MTNYIQNGIADIKALNRISEENDPYIDDMCINKGILFSILPQRNYN